MCSEGDLKDLGVPMGPRKKLAAFVKDHNEKVKRREEESIAAAAAVLVEPIVVETPQVSDPPQESNADVDTDLVSLAPS